MSAILLADRSPHARRMGEKILEDEGYAVVCVADGTAALKLLTNIDPDVVVADAFLPGCSGLDLCRQLKKQKRRVRLILTAGLLDPFDEDEGRRAGCDAIVRKPFEATAFLEAVREQVQQAQAARTPKEDRERIAAEVARQLDAALPKFFEEIAEKVLIALRGR
jgi:DNA-binding response OmpR family regulator